MRLNTYVLFIFQQLVSMFIFKHDSRIAYCLSLFLLIWNDFKITFSLFINFKTDLKRSLTVYHVNELKAYHQTAPWLSNWHHVYVLQWNALTIDFFLFFLIKQYVKKVPTITLSITLVYVGGRYFRVLGKAILNYAFTIRFIQHC